MPIKINFNNRVNSSLQVGDNAYVSDVLPSGITTDPILVGKIIDIDSSYIVVDKDPSAYPIVTSDMFVLFSKRIEANETSLKGYYADITFQNYSNKASELFAVSSNIVPNSK